MESFCEMNEKIIIYRTSKEEFPTEQALIGYLQRGLFQDEQGRFRYTQNKDADIIVLSRNGIAYGHLIVEDRVEPTVEDKEVFPPVTSTYLISSSVVYDNPVKLWAGLGIKVNAWGTIITQRQFKEIQSIAS